MGVAPSTIITRWSLSRIWVLIIKEFRNLLPSFIIILSITLPNLSIPDVPFPAPTSTLVRSRFQVKHATLLNPIDLYASFSFAGGVSWYPIPKWLHFLNLCGECFFTACVVFSFFPFPLSSRVTRRLSPIWCKSSTTSLFVPACFFSQQNSI